MRQLLLIPRRFPGFKSLKNKHLVLARRGITRCCPFSFSLFALLLLLKCDPNLAVIECNIFSACLWYDRLSQDVHFTVSTLLFKFYFFFYIFVGPCFIKWPSMQFCLDNLCLAKLILEESFLRDVKGTLMLSHFGFHGNCCCFSLFDKLGLIFIIWMRRNGANKTILL